MKIRSFAALAIVFAGTHTALAEPASDAAIASYLEDYREQRVSKGMGDDLSLDDARATRDKLAKLLPSVVGEPVGYKAAFTNPAMWERFKVNAPQWGYMFEKNMFKSGDKVTSKLGAKPLYEPDMVAIVKDADLASAKTPLEALQHISYFAPFIELPDAMRESGAVGPALVATNVIFRGGVVGDRIDVVPTQAFLDSLATMTAVTVNETSGKELARAKGDVLLGNPAASALWLAQTLKQAGIAVKPGDILSLGSFNAPVPPQAGTTISVKLQGLPNEPKATVNFE